MRLVPMLVLVAALLAVGGCAESSKDRYISDYQPLNDRLVRVNGRLVRMLNTPSSPGRLANELTPLSGQLNRLSRQVSELDTPEDLREESAALSRSLARTGAGTDRTAAFAREADRVADRAALLDATKDLAADVNRLVRETKRLAEAAG